MELFQQQPGNTVTTITSSIWGGRRRAGWGWGVRKRMLPKCLFFLEHLHLSLSWNLQPPGQTLHIVSICQIRKPRHSEWSSDQISDLFEGTEPTSVWLQGLHHLWPVLLCLISRSLSLSLAQSLSVQMPFSEWLLYASRALCLYRHYAHANTEAQSGDMISQNGTAGTCWSQGTKPRSPGFGSNAVPPLTLSLCLISPSMVAWCMKNLHRHPKLCWLQRKLLDSTKICTLKSNPSCRWD